MRKIFILFLCFAGGTSAWGFSYVNWNHYPKVREFDFVNIPPNLANIDPELIRDWIDADKPARSIDRAKRAIPLFSDTPICTPYARS